MAVANWREPCAIWSIPVRDLRTEVSSLALHKHFRWCFWVLFVLMACVSCSEAVTYLIVTVYVCSFVCSVGCCRCVSACPAVSGLRGRHTYCDIEQFYCILSSVNYMLMIMESLSWHFFFAHINDIINPPPPSIGLCVDLEAWSSAPSPGALAKPTSDIPNPPRSSSPTRVA